MAYWPFFLLIPFATVTWFSREAAFYIILAALPAYLVRGVVFGIPITLLELAIYVVCLISIYKKDTRIFSKFFIKTNTKELAWCALWFILASLSVLFIAEDKRLALGILKAWFFDPLLVVGLGLTVFYKGNRDLTLRNFITALLAGAAAASIWGLLDFLLNGTVRTASWYPSPNLFAMYITPIAVLALSALSLKLLPIVVGYWRVLWYLAVAFILVGILFSNSYSALLALSMGFVMVVVAKSWPKTIVSLLLIVSLAGIFLPWLFVGLNKWPLPSHSNTTYQINSGDIRLVLWREATKVIKNYPVAGLGVGQWQPVFNRDIWTRLPERKVPGLAIEIYYASLFPHNLWLTTWVYLGILGIILLLGLLGLVALAAIHASRAVLALAILFPLLIHGIADTPYYKNDLAILFFLPLLIAMVYKNNILKKA